MKVIFAFFIFLSFALLIGCGETSTNNSVEVPVNDMEASSENTVSTDNQDNEKYVNSGIITDEIVSKACDCQVNAKKPDGTLDVSLMRSCMGGDSYQFVKSLLEANTAEKEINNARKLLKEKMNTQCPM